MHRVDLQPVVAPCRPSLVPLSQASPAAGALRRNIALFRFELNGSGLPAIPVLKLIPRVAEGWPNAPNPAYAALLIRDSRSRHQRSPLIPWRA